MSRLSPRPQLRPRWLSRAGRPLAHHPVTAAAAIATVLGAPLGAVVALATHKLLSPKAAKRRSHVLVLRTEDRIVTLLRTSAATRAGRYGLAWAGGSAILGDVTATSPVTVRRRLSEGSVPGVMRAQLERAVWSGNPADVWGLDFETVTVPGELGGLPAWHVPAARSEPMVLLVHGHGGTLQRCLRPLRAIHDAGLPALVVSWRNDGIAPDSPRHRYHLGDTEWRDLDSAAGWALEHGARRVVPYGFSMGGAIVATFLRRSGHAPAACAIVLDAPVLDWRAVLNHEFHEFKLPLPITPLALTSWLTERRIGVDLSALNLIEHTEALGNRPVLLFQGQSDPVCPPEISRDLARRLPGQVQLVEVPGAGHEASWNVDPRLYEDRLLTFLQQLRAAPPATSPGRQPR